MDWCYSPPLPLSQFERDCSSSHKPLSVKTVRCPSSHQPSQHNQPPLPSGVTVSHILFGRPRGILSERRIEGRVAKAVHPLSSKVFCIDQSHPLQ